MPVGSSAQAFAISAPRIAARATASSAEMTPAIAAAASSPTECPAAIASRGNEAAALEFLEGEQRGGHDEGLGDRRVGDLLGCGGGAEAFEVEAGGLRPQRDAVMQHPAAPAKG